MAEYVLGELTPADKKEVVKIQSNNVYMIRI